MSARFSGPTQRAGTARTGRRDAPDLGDAALPRGNRITAPAAAFRLCSSSGPSWSLNNLSETWTRPSASIPIRWLSKAAWWIFDRATPFGDHRLAE